MAPESRTYPAASETSVCPTSHRVAVQTVLRGAGGAEKQERGDHGAPGKDPSEVSFSRRRQFSSGSGRAAQPDLSTNFEKGTACISQTEY
jgi:hypothetical protein